MRWRLQWNSKEEPVHIELLRRNDSCFVFLVDQEEVVIDYKTHYPYSIETLTSSIMLETWTSSRWRGSDCGDIFDIQPAVDSLQNQSLKPEIRSQMPGRILKIFAQAGDDIECGAPLMIIEAMKMENEVRASGACRIKTLYVSEGQSIESNALLMDFEMVTK